MNAIRITTGCRASGRGFAAGEVASVPAEISADDAALLVRIGRAVVAELPDPSPAPAQPAEKKSGRGNK